VRSIRSFVDPVTEKSSWIPASAIYDSVNLQTIN
jgi:hypothetical protein